MSALGRLGGKAGGLGARLKRGGNVRDELRGIDPRKVREAIERSLTGNNESARVGAIRLLSDLEVYRSDDGCEACKHRESIKEEHTPNLEEARAAMLELARVPGFFEGFIERARAGEGGNGGMGAGSLMGPVRPAEN